MGSIRGDGENEKYKKNALSHAYAHAYTNAVTYLRCQQTLLQTRIKKPFVQCQNLTIKDRKDEGRRGMKRRKIAEKKIEENARCR